MHAIIRFWGGILSVSIKAHEWHGCKGKIQILSTGERVILAQPRLIGTQERNIYLHSGQRMLFNRPFDECSKASDLLHGEFEWDGGPWDRKWNLDCCLPAAWHRCRAQKAMLWSWEWSCHPIETWLQAPVPWSGSDRGRDDWFPIGMALEPSGFGEWSRLQTAFLTACEQRQYKSCS